MNAFDTARSLGWLASQPSNFQDALLSRCVVRHFVRKQRICLPSDPCAGLFALVKGVLKVEMYAMGEFRLFSTRQPVSWFGAAECFRRTSSGISLTAVSPSTLLHLPCSEFDYLIQNPAFCRSFGLLMADHCDEARATIAPFLVSDKELRVAGRLAQMASVLQHEQPTTLHLSQADLADLCGMSRPTIVAVLGKLADLGLIESKYRKISIPDPEALARHVNERRAMREGRASTC